MKKLIFILFAISIMFTMQSCDFLFEKKIETSWKCLIHYECYEEITFFTDASFEAKLCTTDSYDIITDKYDYKDDNKYGNLVSFKGKIESCEPKDANTKSDDVTVYLNVQEALIEGEWKPLGLVDGLRYYFIIADGDYAKLSDNDYIDIKDKGFTEIEIEE